MFRAASIGLGPALGRNIVAVVFWLEGGGVWAGAVYIIGDVDGAGGWGGGIGWGGGWPRGCGTGGRWGRRLGGGWFW
jgi:hypothetical protein